MFEVMIYFGLLGFLMLCFSFLTGTHILKIKGKFRIHKKVGIVGFIFMATHAIFMSYYVFFT